MPAPGYPWSANPSASMAGWAATSTTGVANRNAIFLNPPTNHQSSWTTIPGPWGSTNYIANYHSLGGDQRLNSDGGLGAFTGPKSLKNHFQDGASQTVMLAEAYSWCDDVGRIALDAWRTHNLGISWDLNGVRLSSNPSDPAIVAPFGSPTSYVGNTTGANYLFQIRPLPYPQSDSRCATGSCCNNWTAQSPHNTLTISMADGSARSVNGAVTLDIWLHMLDHRDGEGFELPID
jgi:hypothetical protein